MKNRRTLQELTIKDNFMFGAVMCDENNSKDFLEMLLGITIEHIEVSKERCIAYHPEYKGVRLDVFVKDDDKLVQFLKYVQTDLDGSVSDFEDNFVKKLQESVTRVKESREMGERYMTLQEWLKDEYKEGKRDCLIEQIEKKLVKGKSVEVIAEELEESVDVITELIEEMKNN